MRKTCVPAEELPIERLARKFVLVYFIVVAISGAPSSRSRRCLVVLAVGWTAVAHEGDALRKELIDINASASVSEYKLRCLFGSKIGDVD